ncbi:protein of unknown function (plasmid) [Methylocella tundrae]|uniref:Uncharacterized protein n=1 Tax=Methylocella tundrae TaxID=227605 RepID=A0A4U8Z793_METTU|nr:protein of unknown function [Methylocella tundrae]
MRGYFLRAQMLLHGDRKISAALHRRVIRHDHAFPAGNASDPGDHSGAGDLAVVHSMRGELSNLEERREGINQRVDPLARQHFSTRQVARPRRRSTALADAACGVAEVGNQFRHGFAIQAIFG